MQNDKAGRKALVADEIAFVLAREKDCTVVTDLIAAGKMPLRVTHNDTKLNNIMMDNETDEGICIIDLDTIMPGSSLYDFGDSIRFGASSAAEDEKDLNKVFMKLDLFESYTKGFLSEVGSALTETELEYLAFSAKPVSYTHLYSPRYRRSEYSSDWPFSPLWPRSRKPAPAER